MDGAMLASLIGIVDISKSDPHGVTVALA